MPRKEENKWVGQQNQRVDQRHEQVKFHLAPPYEWSLWKIYGTFILQLQKLKVNGSGHCFYSNLILNQNALRCGEGVGIMRASAEGGNRTLIPGGNTILSRARLPIPPLRLVGQVVLAGCFAINLPYAPQSIPLIRRWSSKMSARQDGISPYRKANPPDLLRVYP